jgi:methyl-accepting chemotaxis protein
MTTRLNARSKLLLSFGAIAMVTICSALFSLYTLTDIRTRLLKDSAAASAHLDDARRITTDLANMRSANRGISVFGAVHNAGAQAKAAAGYDQASADLRKVLEEYGASGAADSDREQLRVIGTGVQNWNAAMPHILELSSGAKTEEAINFVLVNVSPLMDSIQKASTDLVSVNRTRFNESMAAAESKSRTSGQMMIALVIVVALISALVLWIVTQLTTALRGISAHVAASAQQITTSADQVASGSRQLAEAMAEQAASVEETSASAEQIRATTCKARDSAATVSGTVAKATARASETFGLLDKTMGSMNGITKSSEKISEIIGTIEQIAFQTNILALNAAVEAARAGDAGLGFAVVADEVRSLARRCAEAANSTSALITESISAVREGAGNFGQVNEAVRTISAATLEIDKLTTEVRKGTEEQAVGIEQIAKAMSHIEEATQTSAAGAEEASAACAQLETEASELDGMARELAVLIGSRPSDRRAPASTGGSGSPRDSRSKNRSLARAASSFAAAFVFFLMPVRSPAQLTTVEPGKFTIGFEQRVRSDDWNNAIDMSDKTNDQRDQFRDRTRLWFNAPVTSNIDLFAGVAAENTQRFGSVKHFDEVFFDQAYVNFRKVFVKGLSLKLGRQEIFKGEGFILFDGTPGDGPRSGYFNGADLNYSFKKSQLDLMAFADPARDHYLPIIHDQYRLLQNWDEQAVGAYYSTADFRNLVVDGYYFYKKEINDVLPVKNPQFMPDRHVQTAGGRVLVKLDKRTNWATEFARQWGAQHGGVQITGWGGYSYVKHTFDRRLKPYVKAGYWAMSGDDPKTKGTWEGWDPLFSQYPKWSDMYVYTQSKEVSIAYATNLRMSQTEAGFSPIAKNTLALIWFHMDSFHPFAGSAATFGTGTNRGENVQLRWDAAPSPSWKMSIHYETHHPGDFYSVNRAPAYEVQCQVIYQFSFHPFEKQMKKHDN